RFEIVRTNDLVEVPPEADIQGVIDSSKRDVYACAFIRPQLPQSVEYHVLSLPLAQMPSHDRQQGTGWHSQVGAGVFASSLDALQNSVDVDAVLDLGDAITREIVGLEDLTHISADGDVSIEAAIQPMHETTGGRIQLPPQMRHARNTYHTRGWQPIVVAVRR